jgi:cytochrome c-type biogenesis protein CcmH/NrfG
LDRDPWSWYSLGAVYLSLGDVSSAEKLLRQALNQIPEVGQWIMHFPKVVPLPNGTLVDEAFRQAVSYLVDHIDLWPESSRKELQAIGERLVASV